MAVLMWRVGHSGRRYCTVAGHYKIHQLQPQHMVKARIRKFFGAVNAILGQIGGV